MMKRSRRTRLLCWTGFFLPDIGGIEVLLAKVLPELTRRNYEIIVVTSHGDHRLENHTIYEGLPIYRFHFRKALGKGDLKQLLAIRREIAELKRTFQPDLVHCHICDPSAYFHLSTIGAHEAPTVATFHSDMEYAGMGFGPTSLLGKVLGMADWVTAVSEASLEVILGNCPVELAERSSVIYNGNELPNLLPAPLQFDPPRIVFVGRLIHAKGVDLAVKGLRVLRSDFPEARLIITGEGPLRGELQEQADALGLGGAVEFKGRIDPEMVPVLLNSATMVVMPSRTEGLPMVALEAAQMGRPIIATPVGGLPEIVLHEETGLLVEKDNATALAEAMAYLITNRHSAIQMGSAAKKRAEKVFSLERCVDSYDQLYRKLVRVPA